MKPYCIFAVIGTKDQHKNEKTIVLLSVVPIILTSKVSLFSVIGTNDHHKNEKSYVICGTNDLDKQSQFNCSYWYQLMITIRMKRKVSLFAVIGTYDQHRQLL